MNENQNSSHLDFLSLYKESRNLLSFSFVEEEEEYTNEASLFEQGGLLPVSLLKGEVVSTSYLYETEEKRGTPLFFDVIEKEKDGFHKRGDGTINEMALVVLDAYGIHFEEEKLSPSYVSHLFENRPINSKLELRTGLRFYPHKVLLYSSLYPFLRDVIAGKEIDPKFEALFRDVKKEESEKKINEESVGPFGRLDRIFIRLSSYGGAKVTLQGEEVEKHFLSRLLNSFLGERKTIAFFSSEKDRDILKEKLSSLGYGPLIDFEKNSSLLPLPDPKSLSEERKNRITAERYFSFRAKKKQCYVYPKDFSDSSFWEPFLVEQFNSFKPYPLSLADYSEEAFEADKKALDTIEGLKSITSSYVLDHPFFGLTADDSRETFSALQLAFIEIGKDLQTLKEAIVSSDSLKGYSLPLEKGKEIETLEEDGAVLSGYNGFPKKYFRLNQDAEQKYSLASLKKEYQSLSSSKLYLIKLCGEDFLKEDFPSLLEDYHSKNLFRHNRARRKIGSYLKDHKKKDIDLLTEVMEAYQEAKDNIASSRKDYEEVYGDDLSNMNEVVEIESNVAYILSFRKRGKENPDFNLENPWIKKVIRDKDFRTSVLNDIKKITTAYSALETKMKEVQGEFRDRRDASSWKDYSFEDIDSFFKSTRTLTYEEYKEYLTFRDAFRSSSLLLQRTIRRYEDEKRPLKSLKQEYLYSLGVAYFLKGTKAFAPYEKDYDKVASSYYASLTTYSSMLPDHNYAYLYDALSEKKEETITLKFFTPEEAISLKEDSFDLVVLVNSSSFSSAELLSLLKVGKENLALAFDSKADKRFFGYHETLLNRNLYRRTFPFEKITNSYLSFLEEEAKKHGFTLKQDDPRYPLILEKDGKEEALLPDILIPYQEVAQSIQEYTEGLSYYTGLALVEFDAYAFLEYPDHLFTLLA